MQRYHLKTLYSTCLTLVFLLSENLASFGSMLFSHLQCPIDKLLVILFKLPNYLLIFNFCFYFYRYLDDTKPVDMPIAVACNTANILSLLTQLFHCSAARMLLQKHKYIKTFFAFSFLLAKMRCQWSLFQWDLGVPRLFSAIPIF